MKVRSRKKFLKNRRNLGEREAVGNHVAKENLRMRQPKIDIGSNVNLLQTTADRQLLHKRKR